MDTKNSYNSDYHVRDAIIFNAPVNDNYDIAYFSDLSLEQLDALIEQKYIHTDDSVQNGNLLVCDLRQFMFDHPGTTAHGYIVTINREDYRTSLEGLELKAPYTDKDRGDFFFAMNGADDLSEELSPPETCGKLYAWWD